MEFLQEKANVHLSDYSASTRLCVRKLAQTFSDLGLSKEEQILAFEKITALASCVWSNACEDADIERQSLRDRVEKDLVEVQKIKEALGDDEADLELGQCLEEAQSPSVTLRNLHGRVLARLGYWKGRRSEKLTEYELIMAASTILKTQLGLTQMPIARPDLSRANLDFLRMEQDKLRSEKERRIARLLTHLDQLCDHCEVVGEPCKQAIMEVHHSLRAFWEAHQSGSSADSLSAEALLKLSTVAGAQMSMMIEEADAQVELSDVLFDRLKERIQQAVDLKAQREAHLQELCAVLSSLWEALGGEVTAAEKTAVSDLFTGPQKLHGHNIQACQAEVSRLEQQKTQAMKDLVVSKAKELEELCASTLMVAPDVTTLLMDMSQGNRKEATGQIGEVLSKLVRMIGEVQGEARKRSSLVGMISELEGAKQELAWVTAWEQDEQRYKGRDSTRNLNRSIRASKLRERVPSLIAGIREAAQDWRLKEGAAFLVHGSDYAETALPSLAQELEQAAADKAHQHSSGRAKEHANSTFVSHNNPPSHRASKPSTGAGHVVGRPAAPKPPLNAGQHTFKQSNNPVGALTPEGLAKRHSLTGPIQPPLLTSSAKSTSMLRGAALSQSAQFTPADLTGAVRPRTVAASTALTPPKTAGSTPGFTPPRIAGTNNRSPLMGGSISRAAAAASPCKDPLQDSLAHILAASPKQVTPGSAGSAGDPRSTRPQSTFSGSTVTPVVQKAQLVNEGVAVHKLKKQVQVLAVTDDVNLCDILASKDTTTPKKRVHLAPVVPATVVQSPAAPKSRIPRPMA